MATVTKCDRCKKYIDRLPDSLPHIMHKQQYNSTTSVAHSLEVCPECYESFLNWANKFDKVRRMIDYETDDE